MTPWECAEGLKDFLSEVFTSHEEMNEETGKPVNVYVGFLPYTASREAKKKLCPAIVVRPISVRDATDASTVSISVMVTTYDEDMIGGSASMYHLAELIRYSLLAHSPIKRKWRLVRGSMESTFPDEQPYPQWWGRIDFDVTLPQPENHIVMNKWTGGT